jgi:hypothetical protein
MPPIRRWNGTEYFMWAWAWVEMQISQKMQQNQSG